MRRKRLVVWLGISLWLAAGIRLTQGADLGHFQAMQLVRFPEALELPPLSLPDLEGKSVALESFRGKVVLLNFWTTW
jgi:hypothetical protein